jgi:hypothetical protein
MLLAPALLMAQDADTPDTAKRKIPVTSLLPPGSIMAGVMLPRYDASRHLIGVLRAKSMTLTSSEILDGEAVSIELFNSDHSSRVRMDMLTTRFDQSKGILSAKQTVCISSSRIITTGAGLIYEVDQTKGFLIGPATTRIKAIAKTTMHTTASSLHTTALVSAALLVAPVTKAPAEETVVPREDAVGLAQGMLDANAQARAGLRQVLSASAEATRAATAFLEQEELLAKATPAAPPSVMQAKTLDVTPGPNDTVINCDGGMYFDAEKCLLVYLKNVTVADPRFSLDGASEIKIFFEKKPEKPRAEPKPDAKPVPGGMDVKIGDVERVIATGAVHILQKPEGNNEAIEAAGALFTYNFKTGEIILSGGKPWVKKGGMINRAKQSNQTIRIIEGKFTFSEGGTETILPLDQLKQKAK